MSKIYYIDIENIGRQWIKLLDAKDSRFLVFYTEHSYKGNFSETDKMLNAETIPEFIKCYEGKNALDFQLVSKLGYELRENSSNEMIILSDDKGYDSVVKFWRDKGMKVERIPFSEDPKSKKEKKDTPENEDKNKESVAKAPESISGIDKRELYTIINCIGAKDTSNIHMALTHFYGNKNGVNIYKNLKKDSFEVPPVQWTPETKVKKFIELILKYENKEKITLPDTFPAYMYKNIVDDKKAMAEKLKKSFMENGTKINSKFKPYYKILSKMKKEDEQSV